MDVNPIWSFDNLRAEAKAINEKALVASHEAGHGVFAQISPWFSAKRSMIHFERGQWVGVTDTMKNNAITGMEYSALGWAGISGEVEYILGVTKLPQSPMDASFLWSLVDYFKKNKDSIYETDAPIAFSDSNSMGGLARAMTVLNSNLNRLHFVAKKLFEEEKFEFVS